MFLADQHQLAQAAQAVYSGDIHPEIEPSPSTCGDDYTDGRWDAIDTLCACLALADAIHSAHLHAQPLPFVTTTTGSSSHALWTVTSYA